MAADDEPLLDAIRYLVARGDQAAAHRDMNALIRQAAGRGPAAEEQQPADPAPPVVLDLGQGARGTGGFRAAPNMNDVLRGLARARHTLNDDAILLEQQMRQT